VKIRDEAIAPGLFESLRQFARNANFTTVESPYDGVEYPDLVVEIPPWIRVAIGCAIAECMDVDYRHLKIHTQFFRLTTENTPAAPHGAHNDAIHGEFSAFYYVNDKPENLEGIAGTSLLTHKRTGMAYQPRTVEEWEVWNEDTNNYDAWQIDEMVFWEPNRLAIYPAERMHRAEPPGGWGEDASDGRLVLITFFSC